MSGLIRMGRKATTTLVVGLIALGSGVGIPAVAAQDCAGTVSTSVASDAIPGGAWSVTDGCLPAETFFEYSDGPVHAKAAVSAVTYDDGHEGRVAAAVLTLGEGTGLSIVGVEDQATGVIKWSAVLGDYVESGESVSVSGSGVTLFPTTPAELSVSITGTGTDISDLVNSGDVGPLGDEQTTTTLAPDESMPPADAPATSTTTTTTVESPQGPASTTTTTPAPAPVDPDGSGSDPDGAPVMPPAGPTTTTTPPKG